MAADLTDSAAKVVQAQRATRAFKEAKDSGMNDYDENGWAPIHQAAFRGFVKSVDRFVKSQEDQLELPTNDDLGCTPLLLSVMSGEQTTVELLLELGADMTAQTTQNHGVIELAAMKQYLDLINFFIDKNYERLPVWKILVKFLGSSMQDEAEAAGHCIRRLTEPSSEGVHPNWKVFFDTGGVPVCISVPKDEVGDDATVQALLILLNMVQQREVKDSIAKCGGLPVLIKILKGSNMYLVQLAANVIKEMAKEKVFADMAASNNALPALGEVIKSSREPDVLIEVIDALGYMAEAGHQQAAVALPGVVSGIVDLYDQDTKHAKLLLALTTTVMQIVRHNRHNQQTFIDEGVCPHVIILMRVNKRDIQIAAIDCVQALAHDNADTQHALLEHQAFRPLLEILKRHRQLTARKDKREADILEKTARAIWSLAGDQFERRRWMAGMVGVQNLIEFLASQSTTLHMIGSEALGSLAQGPNNKQSEIGQQNGIHPLVRLIDMSDDEEIILSVIRTLRHLCVGVGFVPCVKNQQRLTQSRGLKYLTALMVQAKSEVVQAEAAVSLAYACLGNKSQMEELEKTPDFAYIRVLKMLYSKTDDVRILAGAALAAFAYNSLKDQRAIAECGGIRYGCWDQFLRSSNEWFRCNAAFQIVVLARIIPDEEQAESSAAGIKLLVDLLHDSRSNDILSLAADCLARLAHTRAGVPAAIVAVGGVDLLSNLLLSDNEIVRGSSAIALSYLSHNHKACRKMLNRCRQDPFMFRALMHYNKENVILAPDFVESWEHKKRVGLPPIGEGKPNLVAQAPVYYDVEGGARPRTVSLPSSTPSPLLPTPSGEPAFPDGLGDHTARRDSRLTNSRRGSRQLSLGSREPSQMTPRSRASSRSRVSLSRKSTTLGAEGLLQEA